MARFLHTADWHLGRCFHGESLLDQQAGIIDFIVETARKERPTAILVSGDIYDRAMPAVGAVRLASEALWRLSETAPVILIPGNHDSAARLGFGAQLLDRAGVHIRAVPSRCGEPVVLEGMCVYGVPYLEPEVVRQELGVQERGHQAVLAAAMDLIRTDLSLRAAGTRSIVLSHAFVAGVSTSESERALAVGGACAVPAGLFAGIDYVALGHIHRPQKVGANGRYAGSLLAFSFSEAEDHKSLAMVELGSGSPGVELVPLPKPRVLRCLRGTLEELLSDPGLCAHEAAWVQVTLTDPVRPQDAMERLRRRFRHTAELRFEPVRPADEAAGSYSERLRGLGDLELLERFVRDVRGDSLADEERELLCDAVSAERVREAVG